MDNHGNETFSCSFWTCWAVLKLRDESLENLAGEEHRITPARHIITRDATITLSITGDAATFTRGGLTATVDNMLVGKKMILLQDGQILEITPAQATAISNANGGNYGVQNKNGGTVVINTDTINEDTDLRGILTTTEYHVSGIKQTIVTVVENATLNLGAYFGFDGMTFQGAGSVITYRGTGTPEGAGLTYSVFTTGDNNISGGDNGDTITVGGGTNIITGGKGADQITLHNNGTDTLQFSMVADTLPAGAFVLKNPSDAYVSGEIPGGLKTNFVAPTPANYGADTVTLNVDQITNGVNAQIYGVTLGSEAGAADTLQLGGVADAAALAGLLSSIEVAHSQTPYDTIFTDKDFLSVKLNFTGGGSIELLDLIALDVETTPSGPTVGQTVAVLLEGAPATGNYSAISEALAMQQLIGLLGNNLDLQADKYNAPGAVTSPIILGEVYDDNGNKKVVIDSDSTLAEMDVITNFAIGTDTIYLQRYDGIGPLSSITRVSDVASCNTEGLAAQLATSFAGLESNVAGLVVINNGTAAGTYLYADNGNGNVDATEDVFIKLVGTTGVPEYPE